MPNFAAWNRRSPSQTSVGSLPAFRQGAQYQPEPLIDESKIDQGKHCVLGVLDEPIVLGMEHVMDGSQADVLVHAAVAGDEMCVEQLVVVFGVAVARIGQTDSDVAIGDLADRHGLVCDIGEEAHGSVRMAPVVEIGAADCLRRRCRRPCWECRRAQRR